LATGATLIEDISAHITNWQPQFRTQDRLISTGVELETKTKGSNIGVDCKPHESHDAEHGMILRVNEAMEMIQSCMYLLCLEVYWGGWGKKFNFWRWRLYCPAGKRRGDIVLGMSIFWVRTLV
jgi:hypothetical protein